MHGAILIYDEPDSAALRDQYRQSHMVMARGPLVTDDGEEAIGSVLLLDVPDMDTARVFMEQEPFYSNDVYKEINFHRWRFGRVMDRFK